MQNADAGDSPKVSYAEFIATGAVSPAEFIAGVSGTQVTVSLADLWTVYHYARHFDCDEDPSMERIRKAIDEAEAALTAGVSFEGALAALGDTPATGTSDGPAEER